MKTTSFVRALVVMLSTALTGAAAQAEKNLPPAKQAPHAQERHQLLGTWRAVSWHKGGQALSRAELKKMGWLNLKMTFRAEGAVKETLGQVQVFAYHVDPTKSPREIDLALMPGADVDVSYQGIYQREGDVLTLALSTDWTGRPRDFLAAPRQETHVLVLQRQQEDAAAEVDGDTLARINQAGLVFTAKVTRAANRLEFSEVKMLRGVLPAQPIVPPFEPTLDSEKGRVWLMTTGHYGNLEMLLPLNERLLAQVKQALALPLGWKLENGQAVSPWAELGEKAWLKGTARPPLLAGDPIELTAEQILPPVVHPFRNPYGDGQFKITVTNRSARPVLVPALLSDGQNILWEDSLLVLDVSTVRNYGMPCLLRGAGKIGLLKQVEPVMLAANESRATTVNVLTANGVFFQPGGARYYYRFCLGEKAAANFFYYHSGHHSQLRHPDAK